jgi:hypothetical protein
VRRAGPRAVAGALDKASELFCDGRSREAWALVRAAAEARPGRAADASLLDPEVIRQAKEVAASSAEAGQPWLVLAVQPLVSRWLQRVHNPL